MPEYVSSNIQKTSNRKWGWRGSLSFCAYAVYVLSISTILLFCNSLASFVIYSAIPRFGDAAALDAISQLFFYIIPILLTFFQWYLIDRLMRFLDR